MGDIPHTPLNHTKDISLMSYHHRRPKSSRQIVRNYEQLRLKRKHQIKVLLLNAVTILGFGLAAITLVAIFYSFATALFLL